MYGVHLPTRLGDFVGTGFSDIPYMEHMGSGQNTLNLGLKMFEAMISQ